MHDPVNRTASARRDGATMLSIILSSMDKLQRGRWDYYQAYRDELREAGYTTTMIDDELGLETDVATAISVHPLFDPQSRW